MAESASKKIRLDPLFDDPLFDQFRSNQFQLETLQNALKNTADGTDNVVFLRVIEANAKSCSPFSKATCLVEEHLKPSKFPVCVTLRSIYNVGYEVLDHFLATGKLPKNRLFIKALQKLIVFLQQEGDSALFNESRMYGTDGKWAVVLIQHLLSKLSVSTDFKIGESTLREDIDYCPCEQKEKLICHRGVTSLGCEKGWRGELDIIIGETPVKIAQYCEADTVEETSTVMSRSSLDAELETEAFTKAHRNQMLAQTIVFSFLKKRGLIPLIGLGSSFVKLHFYDCEKDILMRCNTMNYIYSKEKGLLNTRTILMLWLALNHELFCTGVPSDLVEYNAKFHEELGPCLVCYRNTVAPFPCHVEANVEEPEMSLMNIPAIDTFHKPNIEYF